MRRFRNTFTDTDNATLGIVTGAFILLLIIILPRVIPGGRFGVACSDLPSPDASGNNQSILARSRSQGTLALEVSVPQDPVEYGGSFTVQVTFVNTGVGTITLFFKPDELFLGDDGADGISFSLTGFDGVSYSESPTRITRQPSRIQFTNETLHLLGPKQRCTETLTFETARFLEVTNPETGVRIAPNEGYRISAIYRNNSAGIIDTTGLIATPIFSDQGVYVTGGQDIRSNEVSFSVQTAAQQPPPG